MLGYDKYLDSAFWVAGYGAVGEMAMAALSKKIKINITLFSNTQNEVKRERNIPFGE